MKRLLVALFLSPIWPAMVSIALAESVQAPAEVNHQLDFWLGDWQVTETNSHQLAGRAHLEKLLKGAAITMVWSDVSGTEVREWFYYYRPTKRWRQLYISDSGFVKTRELMEPAEAGPLRFLGEIAKAEGGTYFDRSTVAPLSDGRVHQVLERSKDGRSWEVYFDCIYERSPGPSSKAM